MSNKKKNEPLKKVIQKQLKKDEKEVVGKPRVFVVGGGYEYIRLMYRLGYDGAQGLYNADLVLFTGGEDVNPELYGEVPLAKTNFNRTRDTFEMAIYAGALEREIPMIGICRGGQFLNVMNKGKMWQHVNNHCGNHIARVETAPFLDNGRRRTIEVTSTHHQMMIPAPEGIVLMTALQSTEKDSPSYAKVGRPDDNEPDTEAVWYSDTNCLCFQPHPEFASAPAECVDIFEEFLDDWVVPMIPLKSDAQAEIIETKLGSVTPR